MDTQVAGMNMAENGDGSDAGASDCKHRGGPKPRVTDDELKAALRDAIAATDLPFPATTTGAVVDHLPLSLSKRQARKRLARLAENEDGAIVAHETSGGRLWAIESEIEDTEADR